MKATWTLDRGQIRDNDGNVLASVPYVLGDVQDAANGQLMATAPDLLNALYVALLHLEDAERADRWHIPDISWTFIRAAIAKATKEQEI